MYWYYLILKGVKRLLETLGVIKKGDGNYDDIEKLEPNATTELIKSEEIEDEGEIKKEGGKKDDSGDDNHFKRL